jgi:hypothetical protein
MGAVISHGIDLFWRYCGEYGRVNAVLFKWGNRVRLRQGAREIVGILSVFPGTSIPEYPTPSRRVCLQILPPKPGVFSGTSIPRGRDFESGGGASGGNNDRKLTCVCGGSGLSATAGFDGLEI